MATNCVTHFLSGDINSEIIATIYRHSDGYPEVAGNEILEFLAEERRMPVYDSRVGDPPYLAARYVAFLASLFKRSAHPCDFQSVGIITPGQVIGYYEYLITNTGQVYLRTGEQTNPLPLGNV